jgi:hypothetical protein
LPGADHPAFSLGRSAVAAAAYRSGDRLLTDERLAMEFDFAAKDGIEHAEIMAPAGAPTAYRDREVLWNAAEAAESPEGRRARPGGPPGPATRT